MLDACGGIATGWNDIDINDILFRTQTIYHFCFIVHGICNAPDYVNKINNMGKDELKNDILWKGDGTRNHWLMDRVCQTWIIHE